MKKIIIMVIAVIVSHSITIAQKPSKTFKKISKCYEAQVDSFLDEVFKLEKTGAEMDSTARKELEKTIYDAFLEDFFTWAKFSQKYKGEKKFDFKIKRINKFENETNEYASQFKKIMDTFKAERLIITDKEQLAKLLGKEKLKIFIDSVIKKFQDRTYNLFKKL